MRLLSYNILDGGTGRVDRLAEVVRCERPDVLCLVEAEDEAVVAEIARPLVADFVTAPGNDKASALLTRWTIRESVNHAPLRPALTKSLLEATVLDPGGGDWVLGIAHLHHRAAEEDERTRERELDELLDVFAEHRRKNRPHIVCGDFNANAPTQHIDPQRCKPRTRQEWEQNGGQIPRRVVRRMLDAGYVDCLHAVRGAAADRTYSFTTEHPGQRVDYIFAWGIDRTRMKDAWVVQGPGAKEASDHFPVGLEVG